MECGFCARTIEVCCAGVDYERDEYEWVYVIEWDRPILAWTASMAARMMSRGFAGGSRRS